MLLLTNTNVWNETTESFQCVRQDTLTTKWWKVSYDSTTPTNPIQQEEVTDPLLQEEKRLILTDSATNELKELYFENGDLGLMNAGTTENLDEILSKVNQILNCTCKPIVLTQIDEYELGKFYSVYGLFDVSTAPAMQIIRGDASVVAQATGTLYNGSTNVWKFDFPFGDLGDSAVTGIWQDGFFNFKLFHSSESTQVAYKPLSIVRVEEESEDSTNKTAYIRF